jgi:FGFR1 oncogene partner
MSPCLFVNQPKDFWKNELKDFSNKSGAEGSRSAESGPMLLDVLEGYLKYEVYLLHDH